LAPGRARLQPSAGTLARLEGSSAASFMELILSAGDPRMAQAFRKTP
jgi:hypothetical protein